LIRFGLLIPNGVTNVSCDFVHKPENANSGSNIQVEDGDRFISNHIVPGFTDQKPDLVPSDINWANRFGLNFISYLSVEPLLKNPFGIVWKHCLK
jgi:hypothetical protein